jgi:hypothetical protein
MQWKFHHGIPCTKTLLSSDKHRNFGATSPMCWGQLTCLTSWGIPESHSYHVFSNSGSVARYVTGSSHNSPSRASNVLVTHFSYMIICSLILATWFSCVTCHYVDLLSEIGNQINQNRKQRIIWLSFYFSNDKWYCMNLQRDFRFVQNERSLSLVTG